MRKLERPEEPSNFWTSVATAYAQMAAAVSKGETAAFPSLWSKFKPVFAKAQLGKCGYCEGQVLGLQYGDVEHIQPKAEVHDLVDDPNGWGVEVPWASKVTGRETKQDIARPGYWWRAYSWDNYLLSCQTCNQQWKLNLYPVKGQRVLRPTTDTPGVPLLLSPFDISEPHLHFTYGRFGEISGLTQEGKATIITCGLDRPSLRLARQGLASATHEYIDEMAASDLTERELLRLLQTVSRDGADERPYCGMVRIIFQQRTKLSWSQLAELIKILNATATPDRTLCDSCFAK